MQLSRSLFIVIAMSSLVSLPAKAKVDINPLLWGAIGTGAFATFLHARHVDNTKTDVVSRVLNTGSTVLQKTAQFAYDHRGSLAVGGIVAYLVYHNIHTPDTHAAHEGLRWLGRHHHIEPVK